MPNSPSVKFEFENRNVQQTTPMLGVSCVLARTTKGPYDDPSEIITSFSHFQRLFGSEIVPDGSVSNIEKAFMGGSKLRVIRVLGKGATKGVISVAAARGARAVRASEEGSSVTESTSEEASPKSLFKFTSGSTTVGFGLVTKGYGDPIGSAETFNVKVYKQANTIYYQVVSANGQVLEQGPIITYKTADTVNNTSVDYLALSAFAKNSEYLVPVMTDTVEGIKSWNNLIKWLTDDVDGTKNPIDIKLNNAAITADAVTLNGTIGNAGTTPTADEWIASLEFVKDYVDVYQFACSHLHQHLTTDSDILKVHKAAVDMIKELQEYTYYIEVPKYTTHYTQGDQPRDLKGINTWVQTCLGTVGNSKYVAYFGGGIKYYNEDGNLVDSDVLGTIFGLGDASATQFGVWKSFAGMNRGIIYDGNGPVCPNYGSPSRTNELNELAQNYVNIICVKDVPNQGKRTLLWHCFSSQVKQDSERFLAIVRLNLYLKKNFRPILERYLEEPNIWNTWNKIWLEVKPLLDACVDGDAMSEYTWMGDQDANSYSELSVNNEQDVRQGKYKAILKYKDIVPMQEVTMSIIIDQASKSVSIVENE